MAAISSSSTAKPPNSLARMVREAGMERGAFRERVGSGAPVCHMNVSER